MLLGFAVLCAAGITALAADAPRYDVGRLSIGHPWSRATEAGRPVGVAYLSITNNGRTADALLRASTPLAAAVQIHETTVADGMARMRPLDEVPIAPGKTVRIEPGGIHLMLIDLTGPLLKGATVPLTLEFRAAGKITVMLHVE
jgi:copper(I)-binding protein